MTDQPDTPDPVTIVGIRFSMAKHRIPRQLPAGGQYNPTDISRWTVQAGDTVHTRAHCWLPGDVGAPIYDELWQRYGGSSWVIQHVCERPFIWWWEDA